MSDFKQLCVLEGMILGDSSAEEFEIYFFNNLGFRIKFAEEVKTLPGKGGDGGRNDVFFYIHNKDIPRFSIQRLTFNIRWWEDVLNNGNGVLYPQSILEKYPKTW